MMGASITEGIHIGLVPAYIRSHPPHILVRSLGGGGGGGCPQTFFKLGRGPLTPKRLGTHVLAEAWKHGEIHAQK